MTEPSATALPGTIPAPPARLEPDAIGVAQDTIIGMATSAPAAVVAITLAGLAAAAAYGGGVLMLISAVPMLIIANAYRRLNMWNANSGASFEWVGRAINPYLGFLTGWLMIAGYVVGTLSGVEVLGPSVLQIFSASATNKWGNVAIATAVGLIMMLIAVIGIRITVRTPGDHGRGAVALLAIICTPCRWACKACYRRRTWRTVPRRSRTPPRHSAAAAGKRSWRWLSRFP